MAARSLFPAVISCYRRNLYGEWNGLGYRLVSYSRATNMRLPLVPQSIMPLVANSACTPIGAGESRADVYRLDWPGRVAFLKVLPVSPVAELLAERGSVSTGCKDGSLCRRCSATPQRTVASTSSSPQFRESIRRATRWAWRTWMSSGSWRKGCVWSTKFQSPTVPST